MKSYKEFCNERLSQEMPTHRIDDMAAVSSPDDNLPLNTKIYIYGENDEQGTKTPHFHVTIDNRKIELEVELRHAAQLNIWRTKHGHPKSWDGLSNIRKRIEEWLGETNSEFNMTNLKTMVALWNLNNPTNKIDGTFVE